GFAYRVELSTKPEKRIGSDLLWDKAEKILENVLKRKKISYKLNKGDGAFYGPKIDFHIKDSQGRTWQCGTIQLDFAMPERFDLTYMDENNKEKMPVMIHRTVLGSLERFIGILLEHTSGKLPVWLSPVQARVLSFTDRNAKAAEKTARQLEEAGIRTDTDFEDRTVEYKVRDAEMQHIPYIIVIGDKEEKSKTMAVRERGRKPEFGIKPDKFVGKVRKEIENRE
ncbi:threonine--tRNA ligase, partial [Candidatus Pacearchaeota archaeon]|nr:threonine--tRNA ligase [Candidatus Pacearchaeota archaeon]